MKKSLVPMIFLLLVVLQIAVASALEYRFSATLAWSGNKDFDLYTRTPSGAVMYYGNPGEQSGLNWGGDSFPNCNPNTEIPESVSGTSTVTGTYDVWYNVYSDCGFGSITEKVVTVTAITNLKIKIVNESGAVAVDKVLEAGQSQGAFIPQDMHIGSHPGGTGVQITISEAGCATDADCQTHPQHYCKKWVCEQATSTCVLQNLPKWDKDEGDALKTSMRYGLDVFPQSNNCMIRACDGDGQGIPYNAGVYPGTVWPTDFAGKPYKIYVAGGILTCEQLDNQKQPGDWWDNMQAVAGGCCAYPVCPEKNVAGWLENKRVVYHYGCQANTCTGKNQEYVQYSADRCTNSEKAGQYCCKTAIIPGGKTDPPPFPGGGGDNGGGTYCSAGTCVFDPLAVGIGCLADADCTGSTHNECSNNSCVSVDGPGNNQCMFDEDCLLNHTVCQGASCIPIAGAGLNECALDGDCGGSYSQCSGGQCVSVDGAGVSSCSINEDCAAGQYKACNANGNCVSFPGFGTNSCLFDAACPQPTHRACAGGSCEFVPGAALLPGEQGCLFDMECNTASPRHTVCSPSGGCVEEGGFGVSECGIDSDCIGPVADAVVGDAKVSGEDYFPRAIEAVSGFVVVLHSDHDSDDIDLVASNSPVFCPLGDTGGCLTYEWNNDSPGCPALSSATAKNPSIVVGDVGEVCLYTLVVRDEKGRPSEPKTVAITSILPTGNFKIIDFYLQPSFVVPVGQVEAVIVIENIGAGAGTATINLGVLEPSAGMQQAVAGNLPTALLVGSIDGESTVVSFAGTTKFSGSTSGNIPAGETVPFSIIFTVDNSWAGGNYLVNASVFSGATKMDEKVQTLTVGSVIRPVPEFNILLLPALLAIVFFIVFFGTKRGKSSH